MFAPAIAPLGLKNILINFPNRDELLFRIVCALPKASKIGFACSICRSSRPRLLEMACRLISSAILPLKEPERGRPDEGAVEREVEEEEGVGRVEFD